MAKKTVIQNHENSKPIEEKKVVNAQIKSLKFLIKTLKSLDKHDKEKLTLLAESYLNDFLIVEKKVLSLAEGCNFVYFDEYIKLSWGNYFDMESQEDLEDFIDTLKILLGLLDQLGLSGSEPYEQVFSKIDKSKKQYFKLFQNFKKKAKSTFSSKDMESLFQMFQSQVNDMADRFGKGFMANQSAHEPKPGTVCPSVLYKIRISLQNVKPEIWRSFIVSASVTLEKLNDIIQNVMGWDFSHLYSFTIKGNDYEGETPFGSKRLSKIKLGHFNLVVKNKFQYLYDFGDSWEHELIIEEILDVTPESLSPVCLDGANCCPPEDCGGAWEYMEILKAYKKKNFKNTEIFEWMGEDFNPESFDVKSINDLIKPKKVKK